MLQILNLFFTFVNRPTKTILVLFYQNGNQVSYQPKDYQAFRKIVLAV